MREQRTGRACVCSEVHLSSNFCNAANCLTALTLGSHRASFGPDPIVLGTKQLTSTQRSSLSAPHTEHTYDERQRLQGQTNRMQPVSSVLCGSQPQKKGRRNSFAGVVDMRGTVDDLKAHKNLLYRRIDKLPHSLFRVVTVQHCKRLKGVDMQLSAATSSNAKVQLKLFKKRSLPESACRFTPVTVIHSKEGQVRLLSNGALARVRI